MYMLIGSQFVDTALSSWEGQSMRRLGERIIGPGHVTAAQSMVQYCQLQMAAVRAVALSKSHFRRHSGFG